MQMTEPTIEIPERRNNIAASVQKLKKAARENIPGGHFKTNFQCHAARGDKLRSKKYYPSFKPIKLKCLETQHRLTES